MVAAYGAELWYNNKDDFVWIPLLGRIMSDVALDTLVFEALDQRWEQFELFGPSDTANKLHWYSIRNHIPNPHHDYFQVDGEWVDNMETDECIRVIRVQEGLENHEKSKRLMLKKDEETARQLLEERALEEGDGERDAMEYSTDTVPMAEGEGGGGALEVPGQGEGGGLRSRAHHTYLVL